jgi:hypothetical protein
MLSNNLDFKIVDWKYVSSKYYLWLGTYKEYDYIKNKKVGLNIAKFVFLTNELKLIYS